MGAIVEGLGKCPFCGLGMGPNQSVSAMLGPNWDIPQFYFHSTGECREKAKEWIDEHNGELSQD